MPVHVLGVRHHGPGSARAVGAALAELRPDHVVIEGAPELDRVAGLAADPAMRPPVAALVYRVDDPARAAFWPFASFSPEWVALRWAQSVGAHVRFADLPAANHLATPDPDDQQVPDGDDQPAPQPSSTRSRGGSDPIAVMARAAGSRDPQGWWEDAVESQLVAVPEADRGPAALRQFAALSEAMAAVRATEPPPDAEARETLLREAAMRTVIRAALRGGTQTVAVVCGAYHAPTLERDAWPSAAADTALLRGLPKAKVAVTWVPWTSRLLGRDSGYGAGVTAPGWYEHLFAAPAPQLERWLALSARHLRTQGWDASAAATVEATRLADALAALRGRPTPGLDEVLDATRTVMANGTNAPMAELDTALLIGDQMGAVPPDTPMVPLAADLHAHARGLRLPMVPVPRTVTLDLRTPGGAERSVLFNRLGLLGIGWAQPQDAGGTTGTFKELWSLAWTPGLEIELVQAARLGNTVPAAAQAAAVELADRADTLPALAGLLSQCLDADLPDAVRAVRNRLANRAAANTDTLDLVAAIAPLARVRRYGRAGRADLTALDGMLETLITRAGIGLPQAARDLEDAAATSLAQAVRAADAGIALLDRDQLTATWRDALGRTSAAPGTHPQLAGMGTRMLMDAGALDPDEAADRLSRALSLADPVAGAAWVEGFLAGDGILLLHDDRLLALIDTWVTRVAEDLFDDVLPLLRRTFAAMDSSTRAKVARKLAATGPHPATTAPGQPTAAPVGTLNPQLLAAAAAWLGLGAGAPR